MSESPSRTAAAASSESPARSGRKRTEAARAHLLLVDDDADVLEALAELLSDEGYAVSRARNGAEALRLLESMPRLPDAIVLDLVMPILDGRGFLERRARHRRLRRIPVLLVTATPEARGDREPGLQVLRKPVDFSRLRAALERATRG